MLKFFQAIQKNIRFNHLFETAINHEKQGNPEKAFAILNQLYKERPNNVYLRHELIMVKKALKLPIELPEVSKSQHINQNKL